MSNPTHRMECNAEEAQKATGDISLCLPRLADACVLYITVWHTLVSMPFCKSSLLRDILSQLALQLQSKKVDWLG